MSYGTLISTVSVGAGGAATIAFNSIPQTYTDLMLVFSARVTDAVVSGNVALTFNGSTTSYSEKVLYTNSPPAVGSASQTNAGIFLFSVVGSSATANTFSNCQMYIPNYAGSQNKSASSDSVTENNANNSNFYLNTSLWSNTSAITSLSIAANFVQYSTASLYGIK